MSEIIKT